MTQSRDFTDALKPAGPSGASIRAVERARSNINVAELSQHLLGDEFLERQARILSQIQGHKIFSKSTQMNLSRPDRYRLGLARAKKLRRLADAHSWSEDDYESAKYLVDDVSPYTLHTTMFRQTLREQTDVKQREYWLGRHGRWEIIGSYAQTEMGHGSNVQGIELEARWDPETKEFVLHSPSLTSSKWWNGSMGRTANHAIVVAQLLLPNIDGVYKSYGPHPFVVQIRDMKTHLPFDGIVIGDIGPKYGYAPMDNGYMLFNQFRIPHSAFLSRYAKVDRDTGAYTKPENRNVVYGSLTFARTSIVMHARLVLARAVTVAIRYTSFRRQFVDKTEIASGTSIPRTEIPVLDYATVQIRVLPLLATTFALHYAGNHMKSTFLAHRANVEKGDFSMLVELHSLSSGLKSLCTDYTAGGIETCRRAMGGHGYGGYSGLVQLNADYLSKPTVEGDNWMITQQVSKYLIKLVKKIAETSQAYAPGQTSTEVILRRCWADKDNPTTFPIFDDDAAIVHAFEQRAAITAFKLFEKTEVQKIPWADVLIESHKLSQAHSRTILVQSFYAAITPRSPASAPVSMRPILRELFQLYAFTAIQDDGLTFLACNVVSMDMLESLPARILSLMRSIRPHAVRLVDAWAIPDFLLDSALGRSDGYVYEDMFNRVHRLNPLNRVTFNPDYRNEEIEMGANDGAVILAKL